MNSSVLGNNMLDVSLGRHHEPEELCDELYLLSGVLEPLHLGFGHLTILHWEYVPFPVLNLWCSQLLFQGCPDLFHPDLCHKLVRAGVETQMKHSLQHETHVFACLTKTRDHDLEKQLEIMDLEKQLSVQDVEIIMQKVLSVLLLAGGDRIVLPMHAHCIVRVLQEAQHQLFL